MKSEKTLSLLLAIGLAVVTLLLYWRVTGFDFVNYDDQDYVSNNPHVQHGLSGTEILWAFRTGHASNWHPLTWISHMFDWQLYGNKAGGHHFTNLILHIAASVMLFLVLQKMTGAIWRSVIVAALFAWHPIHVESVAWIAERKDVLSAFFWMLTLWTYVDYVQKRDDEPVTSNQSSGSSTLPFCLCLISFALGLMAKPMLVTLPFVLLLLDVWPLRRVMREEKLTSIRWKDVQRLLVEKVPFFVLAAASSAVTFFVQRHAGTVRTLTSIPFEYRLVNVFLAYLRYLGKMLWPSQLAVFYPLPDFLSLFVGLAASAVLVAVTALIFWRTRRERYLLVGWLWYIGTLVPVVGLVQVGAQSMADRYSYIPSIGIFILFVWWVADVTAKVPQQKVICGAGVVLILAACAVRTSMHLPNWKNSIALFQHALEVTGNSFVANINLGSAYLAENRLDEALFQYNESLKSDSTFEAHGSIAMILEKKGQLKEAAEHFRMAVDLQPNDKLMRNNYGAVLLRDGKLDEAAAQFTAALRADPNYVQAHINLGVVLQKQQRFAESSNEFRAALASDPNDFEVHAAFGDMLVKSGNVAGAIAELSAAVRIKPNSPEAHYNLAAALAEQKKIDQAIEQYNEAIRLRSDYADARNNLSVLLADKQQWAEAAAQLEQVVRLRADDAQAHFNLSYVLSKLGQRKEAKTHYDLALQLNPDLLKSRRR